MDMYKLKNDSDALNQKYLFSLTANDLLIAILAGQIDPKELAKKELSSRGFDEKGNWVGIKNK